MSHTDLHQTITELRKQRSHHLIDESDYIEAMLALISSREQEARIAEAKKMYSGVDYSCGLEARYLKDNNAMISVKSVVSPLQHHIEVLEATLTNPKQEQDNDPKE